MLGSPWLSLLPRDWFQDNSNQKHKQSKQNCMDLKMFPDIQTLATGFLLKGTIHCLARLACSLLNPLAAYADYNASFVTFHMLCLGLRDDMRCLEKVWGHLIKRDTDSLYRGDKKTKRERLTQKQGANPKSFRGFGSDHFWSLFLTVPWCLKFSPRQ